MQKTLENQPHPQDNSGAIDGAVNTIESPLTNPRSEGAEMADSDPTPRKPLSNRTRFEVFKRDEFTCKYCGRKSPDIVLEVDHIVPVCEGGSDDPINLTTSCWECNSGKAGVPLAEVLTGEDPHDRAVMLLERQRQLREYDQVQSAYLRYRENRADELQGWWNERTGAERIPWSQYQWLVNVLCHVPSTAIKEAMGIAISRGATNDWRYVMVVVRNWRDDGRFPVA